MIKRIKFLIIALLTFLLLVTICHFLFYPANAGKIYTFDKEWSVEFNEESFENITLYDIPKALNYASKKVDTIVLSRTIPESSSFDFPTLMFLSRYSAFDLFIDNELVHSEYKDLLKNGDYIGCSYHVVPVPEKDHPMELRLVLYVEEDSFYNYFVAPVYGDYHDVMRFYIFHNMFPLASGIFLIIFGAAFLIITLSFYKTLPNILSQLFASVLFIDLGLWLLGYFRLIDFFIDTKSKATEIEYVSLYLMVPLTYLIVSCIQQHYRDWIFMVVSCTSSFICIGLIVLHFTGVIHMNRTLPYYQCISILCSFFMLIIFFKDFKQKKLAPAEVIQLLGLSVFALSYIINYAAFSLEIRNIVPSSFLTIRMIPMAGLIFVFANLINYFIYLSESFAMRKEYASLTHLAYADGLTDLPNRSRYDKYLEDLDKSDDDYCIVSLDLNGLKEINDSDGHAAGDKYLLEFSQVLKQCFDDKAFIARIGGDEFVAILKKEHFDEVDTLLTRFKDALEVKNVLYPGYRRSVASGYAFSTEVEQKNSHSVYLLADKRMYENKKLMHAKLGIVARI
ncbi:GGDEF domain-containing protein [Butyrivibrio sp. INlla16]|uniref:GGDEF domain-containing protein n=1 Tax=Butyrivibrio sp. INlla16 TaxID=1520807 RepID=UPI00088297C7|nr:GGDEF domain-containing protein [Butyrivibrio sp. INlla16]SDB59577.1 diguanylate cyclase (GGDEF) domain-containing protein [Butyrivibrio sp. INlla16]